MTEQSDSLLNVRRWTFDVRRSIFSVIRTDRVR